MTEFETLSALIEKYARLSGELKANQARVLVIKESLVHLKATIKLFDEQGGSVGVSRGNLSKWFTPGECSRTTLDIMREAKEPLSARQIAVEVMRRCEIPDDKPPTVKRVTFSVFDVLRRREGTMFERTGTNPTVWTRLPL